MVKYEGAALSLYEVLTGKVKPEANKVYESESGIYWYVNKSGVLHIYRPVVDMDSGDYMIQDQRMTEDGSFKHYKMLRCHFKTEQEVFAELKRMVS